MPSRVAKTQAQVLVDVGDEQRQVVGDVAQQPVARGQPGLSLLSLRDVVQEGVGHKAIGCAQGAYRQLDGNLMPVPVQFHELDSLVDERARAGVDELLQARVVTVAHARRDDDLGESAPENACAPPAERGLGLLVPLGDEAMVVHADEGVRCVRQDAANPLLAALQLRGPCSGVLGMPRRPHQQPQRQRSEQQGHRARDSRLAAPVGQPFVHTLADAHHQPGRAHSLEAEHALHPVNGRLVDPDAGIHAAV